MRPGTRRYIQNEQVDCGSEIQGYRLRHFTFPVISETGAEVIEWEEQASVYAYIPTVHACGALCERSVS